MSFPTTNVLDNFNRANENPLANGTWNGPIVSGNTTCQISTNVVISSAVSNIGYGWWTPSTFGPDSEAFGTIGNTAQGDNQGVYARVTNPNTASASGYAIRYQASVTTLQIRRLDNGTHTTLASTSVTLADGNKIGLEIIGNTITAYTNTGSGWTSAVSTTDSTYTGAGYIGLMCDSSGGVGASLDDFGGGTAITNILFAQSIL